MRALEREQTLHKRDVDSNLSEDEKYCVKENRYTVSHTAMKGLRRAYRASVNKRIAQKSPLVNLCSMQDGENDSQKSIVNRP